MFFPPIIAMAAVLDRVVVEVGTEVILASDIQLEDALAAVDPTPIPQWLTLRVNTRERLIDAATIRNVAASVRLYTPRAAELDARVDALRMQFPSAAAWEGFRATWQLDDADLRILMKRRMVVEAYLLRNVPLKPTDPGWGDAAVQYLDAARDTLRIRVTP